jgi:acetyl esterase/lipase
MRWTRRGFLGLGASAVAVAACGDGSDGSGGGAEGGAGVEVVTYGDTPPERLEVTRPSSGRGPWPVVALVHGGFWQAGYDLDLMRPLVAPLLAEGWAVANLDYRGVGLPGAGWPGTLTDAATALDALADVADLDLERLVTLGHSAGGHLAVWLAGRHRLPAGAPGADPVVRPIGAVAQAGVVDLEEAARARLGAAATQALLGGEPDEVPERYAVASPVALLPLGVPVELVHSDRDRIVPLDQSRRYVAAAGSTGDAARLTVVSGDHFAVIDPGTDDWAACLAAARRLLGG